MRLVLRRMTACVFAVLLSFSMLATLARGYRDPNVPALTASDAGCNEGALGIWNCYSSFVSADSERSSQTEYSHNSASSTFPDGRVGAAWAASKDYSWTLLSELGTILMKEVRSTAERTKKVARAIRDELAANLNYKNENVSDWSCEREVIPEVDYSDVPEPTELEMSTNRWLDDSRAALARGVKDSGAALRYSGDALARAVKDPRAALKDSRDALARAAKDSGDALARVVKDPRAALRDSGDALARAAEDSGLARVVKDPIAALKDSRDALARAAQDSGDALVRLVEKTGRLSEHAQTHWKAIGKNWLLDTMDILNGLSDPNGPVLKFLSETYEHYFPKVLRFLTKSLEGVHSRVKAIVVTLEGEDEGERERLEELWESCKSLSAAEFKHSLVNLFSGSNVPFTEEHKEQAVREWECSVWKSRWTNVNILLQQFVLKWIGKIRAMNPRQAFGLAMRLEAASNMGFVGWFLASASSVPLAMFGTTVGILGSIVAPVVNTLEAYCIVHATSRLEWAKNFLKQCFPSKLKELEESEADTDADFERKTLELNDAINQSKQHDKMCEERVKEVSHDLEEGRAPAWWPGSVVDFARLSETFVRAS